MELNSIVKNYITVDSVGTVNQLLEHIEKYDILAIDTETTGLNVRKESIIGWSICGNPGESYYMPTWKWDNSSESLVKLDIQGKDSEELSKKIIKKLKGKKLVAHNASFDFRIIKNYYGVDLLEDLWVDTGMLVHTVEEEGAFGYGSPFALKSIALMNQESLGLDMESAANEEQVKLKESVHRNGGSTTKTNFEIYKADLSVLCEYGAADTDLTLRICNLYLERLYEEGLEKFFFEDEVMPIYKEVTVPMEDRGIKLDLELLKETDVSITEDLEKYKKAVIESIMDLDGGVKWMIDKSLENFPPSNKGNWAQTLCMMYSVDLPKTASGKYSLTAKNIEKLDDSPVKQFLLTGNLDLLKVSDIGTISMQMWKDLNDGDPINIQSTSHLSDLIFNYLGETAKDKTASGRDKFDIETLDYLSKKYVWAENLQVFNRLSKIKSTYVDRFLNKNDDGFYYFYFKQNGTVSGRYGSDLQQLPRRKEEGEAHPIVLKYNNLVRAFLVAREGYSFIDDDYSSLEPRVFAHVANDPNLKKIFNEGLDFYSHIAIQTEKLEGVSAHPKDYNFLKKVQPTKRQSAKAYSLGIPYGLGAFALGKTLDIPTKEAEDLVKGYLEGFPELSKWMDNSKSFVKNNGYINIQTGRRRHLPKVKKIYDTLGDSILDWNTRRDLEARFGKEKVDRAYLDYKNGVNNSLNVQIQSLSASIVNRAALAINRKFKELGIDGLVIAQVHDQLICEVFESFVDEAKPIVQDCMENTTKLDGLDLIAVPEVAKNMAEGH
jgi:DNA polymerase I-like protein with 3'-5' exonuclease and polymerase domains